MAMELEYDRSLYGVEHVAGPFEITNELIDRANSSTGEAGAAFKSDDGAKEAGYRGRIARLTAYQHDYRLATHVPLALGAGHEDVAFHQVFAVFFP